MDNNIFENNTILVCRSSNVSDLQYSFTQSSQDEMLNIYEEFLEEHFEEEERDIHRNSTSTFAQFIEEEFEIDEIPGEFNLEVYQDVSEGFGRDEEDVDSIKWTLSIY